MISLVYHQPRKVQALLMSEHIWEDFVKDVVEEYPRTSEML